MPVVSEIVRVSKSNLHYAIAYRMRAKFNCWIISYALRIQNACVCVWGGRGVSTCLFVFVGLPAMNRMHVLVSQQLTCM